MNQTHERVPLVRRRDGSVVDFDCSRIERAITAAFLRDANGIPRHAGGNQLPPAERDKVERLTDEVVHAVNRYPAAWRHPVHIEEIQDQVELALMRCGEHEIARDYVLYRERRRQLRVTRRTTCQPDSDDCEACQ